ncbi:MAG TPA: hypothetical protein VN174_03720 [Candidatus Methanoperedens sp.]|nr:hypothetical protein [Candidatus Methanoperedens sp.]
MAETTPQNIEIKPKQEKLSIIANKLISNTSGDETTQRHSISSTLGILKAEENLRLAEYRNTMYPSEDTKLLIAMATDQKNIASSFKDVLRFFRNNNLEEFDNTANMTQSAYSEAIELGFNAQDLETTLLELKPMLNRVI